VSPALDVAPEQGPAQDCCYAFMADYTDRHWKAHPERFSKKTIRALEQAEKAAAAA
jgi:hypothetical protein